MLNPLVITHQIIHDYSARIWDKTNRRYYIEGAKDLVEEVTPYIDHMEDTLDILLDRVELLETKLKNVKQLAENSKEWGWAQKILGTIK
jgi:hypothetical protein